MQHTAPHGIVSDLHRLTSFEDVCRALGGSKKVCELTGNSRASLSNWRKVQRFPARHYRLMRDALLTQGFIADLRLWGFTTAPITSSADTVAA